MDYRTLDFNRISQALDYSMEMLVKEMPADQALIELKSAQHELRQALSFSLSGRHK
jgi:hypothetical protein